MNYPHFFHLSTRDKLEADAEDVSEVMRLPEDAIVMHPGPVNRGTELDDAVCDGPRSLILQQVTGGVAVRMASLLDCLGG